MPPRNRRPTMPGEILKELYLDERGITISAFAVATGLTRKHVSNIVNGRAAISSETAVKFARVLGTTAELWINLQRAVDLHDARRKLSGWKPGKLYPAGQAAG